MRRAAIVVLVIAALATLSGGARASHPEDDPNGCSGTIGGWYLRHNPEPVVQVPVVAQGVIVPLWDARHGPFYLDVRDVASAHWGFSLWFYQETNRQAGLQRGGRAIFPDTPSGDSLDLCQESSTPDQVIF